MRKKLVYHKKYNELSPKENRLLNVLTKAIKSFVSISPKLNKKQIKTRDVHATTYSVLKGKLFIDSTFEKLNIFPSSEMEVIARLSNAQMKIVKGYNLPAFGFALKLRNKDEDFANFPLVNFPLFPFTNITHFLNVFIETNKLYLVEGIHKLKSILKLCYHLLASFPSFLHPSLLKNGFRFLTQIHQFILNFDYYSIGVYRYGNHMIKIKLEPFLKTSIHFKNIKDYMKNYKMYEAKMYVQFAYDETKQPINQLNKEWKDAPYVYVGKLIFNEMLDSNHPEIEALSFNPFENTESFLPVGKIQQLRQQAYQASIEERNK